MPTFLPQPARCRVCFTLELYRGGIKRCVLTHVRYARKTKARGRVRPPERVVIFVRKVNNRHKELKFSIETWLQVQGESHAEDI